MFSTQNGLKIIYLNARSLKAFVSSDEGSLCKISKITLLQQLIFGSSYDVVCICETWLNNAVLNGEFLPGYNIFRKDRTGKIGGGVHVAIKSKLEVLYRPDLERPDCELVVVQIKNQNRKPVTLYTFYRPPNSTHNYLNELNDSLQSNVEKDCVVVVGDFNLPELKWSEDQTTPINSAGQTGETFCELFNDNFLQQNIMGYTHIGGNKLNLSLSNNPEIIRDVRVLCDEQFPSDHFPTEFVIKQSFKRAYRVRRRIYDFRSGQFEQLRTFLKRSAIEVVFSGDIDECWIQWKTQFKEAVDQFIPSKTIVDKNNPPWVDREVQHLIRKKYTELNKYRLNKCETRKTKSSYSQSKSKEFDQGNNSPTKRFKSFHNIQWGDWQNTAR